MARRRLTIKRLDPWSVLKFSILAHLVGFAILMLVAGVIYYIIDQLQLIDQACGIAADVGFTTCGINSENLFRALALLGGMGVIVATAVTVFLAFLYNLIADLTGGLTIGIVDDSPAPQRAAGATATTGAVPMDRVAATGRNAPVREQPVPVEQRPQDPSATARHEPVSPQPRSQEGDELFR